MVIGLVLKMLDFEIELSMLFRLVVEDVVRGVVGLLATLRCVVVGRVVGFLDVVVDAVVEEDLDEGDFWMRNLTGLFLEILFHQGKADIVLVRRMVNVVVELVANILK